MGSGIHIKRAIKKYGSENFTKEILYSNIQYKKTADDVERFAIAKERAIGKAEYNIADGGQGGSLNKGMHFSEEARKHMSEAHKGKPSPMKGKHIPEETKKKISVSEKGRHHSEETKRKIGEANKRRTYSEETRRKISEARKGKPGLPHSEEVKRKISESKKGKKREAFSDEWKRKLSEARKGKHWKLIDGKRVYY